MASIPASDIVNINANVLSAGGSQLAMNGVFMTDSNLLSLEQVLSFASADDVADFFSFASDEYLMAVKYFNGYSISQSKPGQLYFYRPSFAPTSAVLEGAPLGLTLSGLQAVTGTFTTTIVVDGVTVTSTAFTGFASATSFDNAAVLLQNSFTSPNFRVEWNTTTLAFDFISNTTGVSSTIAYASGALATTLKLTSATSAVLVQGTAGTGSAGVTASMDALTDQTGNWATLTHVIDFSLAIKQALADWVSAKNAEYSLLLWDESDDASNTSATGIIWNYIKDNAIDNVFLVGKQPSITIDVNLHAAMVAGSVASVDFTQTNNRPTFAFKSQAGLDIGVDNQTISHRLIANGYNFYGVWATRNDEFRFLYPGQVSGTFQWMDALVNAIYMKARMQLTLLSLLTSVSSIPYNQQGYQGLIATSLIGDINDFINYGAIRVGVQPTATQIAITQAQAGVDISQALFNKGYYLQVKDPGGAARQARTSPVINFWYMDGGAIQKINLTATLIQ